MDVETACRQAALSIGYPELKAEQLEAMKKTFVSRRDVFVVLPNDWRNLFWFRKSCHRDLFYGYITITQLISSVVCPIVN